MRLFQLKEDDDGNLTATYAVYESGTRVHFEDVPTSELPGKMVELFFVPKDEQAEAPKPLRGHLPAGFPGKAALEAAGYDTYAKVRKLHDAGALQAVDGIGPATEDEIKVIFAGVSVDIAEGRAAIRGSRI